MRNVTKLLSVGESDNKLRLIGRCGVTAASLAADTRQAGLQITFRESAVTVVGF